MNQFPVNFERRYNDKSIFYATVALIIAAAVLTLILLFNALYIRIYVVGSSMKNTLTGAPSVDRAGGDYVYICRYIEPKRGDIVVIDAGNRSLIKRVIALGGDRIKLDNGVLYLNGQVVEEPYVSPENNKDVKKNTFEEITVKQGEVFFMGDNRDNSEDSRGDFYGCMPVERISGVVTGWSMQYKQAITNWNTFFEFTLPEIFGEQNNV